MPAFLTTVVYLFVVPVVIAIIIVLCAPVTSASVAAVMTSPATIDPTVLRARQEHVLGAAQALEARLQRCQALLKKARLPAATASTPNAQSMDSGKRKDGKAKGGKAKSSPSPSPSPSTSPESAVAALELPPDDDPSQWWLVPGDTAGASARLIPFCQRIGLTKFRFIRVASDYYSWSLQKRMEVLGVPSIYHLCKSVLMENVRRDNGKIKDGDGDNNGDANGQQALDPAEFDPINPRYMLILVSYTEKLHKEKLCRASVSWHQQICQQRHIQPWLTKKNYNWRLAPEDVAKKITGYEHNATTPLDMNMQDSLPILMPSTILSLSTGSFALGGGEVDVKWRVSTKEFVQKLKPFVADITVPDENAAKEDEAPASSPSP